MEPAGDYLVVVKLKHQITSRIQFAKGARSPPLRCKVDPFHLNHFLCPFALKHTLTRRFLVPGAANVEAQRCIRQMGLVELAVNKPLLEVEVLVSEVPVDSVVKS